MFARREVPNCAARQNDHTCERSFFDLNFSKTLSMVSLAIVGEVPRGACALCRDLRPKMKVIGSQRLIALQDRRQGNFILPDCELASVGSDVLPMPSTVLFHRCGIHVAGAAGYPINLKTLSGGTPYVAKSVR